MQSRKQVVVIGLGRFGTSLARTLSELGHEVLGLDTNLKRVEEAAEFATQAVQADATDGDALRELGVSNFDIGVVGIGADLKSSIMATLLLKRLGVKMVISKALDELQGEILERVGADRVYPERDTGLRVAHGLATPNLIDYLQVMPGYGIAKLIVPLSFAGKELGQLDLKGKFGLTTLILCRGKELLLNPSRTEMIGAKDILVVTGRDEQLEALRTP